ncbi:MAG: phytanoyl-CoA dioxygenase family protein [Candidatus Didemnitutus sp.]|nr:phytanoyl-CoA dioxygenase family protein [Candidatus Didemnitutus sp.]
MSNPPIPLAPSDEAGSLGVLHLKRLWTRARAARGGWRSDDLDDDQRDHLVIDALGLGLEQARRQIMESARTFEEFEKWVVATSGEPEPARVARLNAALCGEPPPPATRAWLAQIDALPPVLSAEDLAHWEEHGYVIVHDAVPEESRRAAEAAIWENTSARPDDPTTWYADRGQGIMLQLFQHPAFTANRRSPRIHKAFAQLWGTADLWVTCDRGGFNPPLRPGETFRASDLHWDVSLARPIPFGTQGILYLTDTPPEQGAFRCVPGFHRRLEAWLDALPTGTDPRQQDLHALGVKHIGGRAGDLVIWSDKLPHGASPNHGARPRIVQYLNMYPARRERNKVWL